LAPQAQQLKQQWAPQADSVQRGTSMD